MSNTKTVIPPCPNPKVPKSDIEFRHIMELQVRFSDIDIFGHVNNGAYLSMMDLAKATYYAEVGALEFTAESIRAVVVNINCNFYSPAYFGEPLAVATAVKSVSERSFVIEQRLFNRETGDVKCTSHTVLAGFDPATAKSAPIAPELVARFESYEGRSLSAKG